jgi:murein DD-endopeptidase MepM/ murein hydrolase activator NlpD
MLTAVFLIASAPQAEARHNSGSSYSSSVQRKIDKLDNDEVEEFAIPILFGVDLSDITPNFGDPRDGGARTHEGLDIMGKLGTPIVSPTAAVVTSTGDGDSSGKYVRTANPGGESFVYMHLDDIANIKTGDVLKVGDLIGMTGDTGNAKGGPAHLHFEVREREAKDPYERMKETFTLEEKMEFVVNMFEDLDDEDEVAEFLVANFTSDFKTALNAGYELPTEIEKELKERGIVSTKNLEEKLALIIKGIPRVISRDLMLGTEGKEVTLLQIYLIYEGKGPAASKLRLSGATGYFGPATEAALKEWQTELGHTPTGIFKVLPKILPE